MVEIYTDDGEFTQTGSEICNHINDIRIKSCELDYLAKIEENIPELILNLQDIQKHSSDILSILAVM